MQAAITSLFMLSKLRLTLTEANNIRFHLVIIIMLRSSLIKIPFN